MAEFVECESCASKSGTPVLCKGCLENRQTITELEDTLRTALIALNQVPNTQISGKYKNSYQVCSVLEQVLGVTSREDEINENKG